MAFTWRDVFDLTVFMFKVVPVYKTAYPCLASSIVRKPFSGHQGQYFSVRNNDSEYGLWLLTLGRESFQYICLPGMSSGHCVSPFPADSLSARHVPLLSVNRRRAITFSPYRAESGGSLSPAPAI